MITTAVAYDEALEPDGAPRPHYAGLLEVLRERDLARLDADVAALLAARDVTFGGAATSLPFSVDPVPRVITAAEWAVLEAGMVQRVNALNEFVTDVYGERRIVEAGVVPRRVVEGASYHVPLLSEAAPLRTGPVTVAGLDVVRDVDGSFLILEDNVRTPSGLAYATAARDVLDALLPAPPSRRFLDPAFDLLGDALRAAAPEGRTDPCIVLLSDGPANSAWYEHRAIARRLGIPLVGVSDLQPRATGLFVRDGGATRRVDVVYRRTDEDRLHDESGRLTPVGAVLLEPCLRGQVRCVNSFRTGVADDKLTHAYVEDMIRFYLGEEPLVRSVPTYDLDADAGRREELLDRIDELVVKPRAASGGHGILIGPHARAQDCTRMADAVRRDPGAVVAQETIWLSRHPTVVDGRLEPRHIDLRAFVLSIGKRVMAVPGGLTRVARDPGALVVNSSQNGGGKDTWVLG